MEFVVNAMILWVIWLIQSALPYLFAGSFIGLVTTLIIRDDLVAKTIANGLSPQFMTKKKAEEPTKYWTDLTESLTAVLMPPTVRAQTMINYLQEFKDDRLKPLVKRLENLEIHFAETIHMSQRAWTAYK